MSESAVAGGEVRGGGEDTGGLRGSISAGFGGNGAGGGVAALSENS